jgi:hypothetical protein
MNRINRRLTQLESRVKVGDNISVVARRGLASLRARGNGHVDFKRVLAIRHRPDLLDQARSNPGSTFDVSIVGKTFDVTGAEIVVTWEVYPVTAEQQARREFLTSLEEV